VVEDSLVDGAGQREDALRQLGQNERQHDDDEHQSRATIADVVRRRRRRLATTADEDKTPCDLRRRTTRPRLDLHLIYDSIYDLR